MCVSVKAYVCLCEFSRVLHIFMGCFFVFMYWLHYENVFVNSVNGWK